MQFGIDEYAKAIFIKGKVTETSNVNLDKQDVITELEPAKSYKYRGVFEGEGIKHFSDERIGRNVSVGLQQYSRQNLVQEAESK